jgi:hypothetical protein
MKSLVIAFASSLALAAGGCTTMELGHITATWQLANVNANGSLVATACPAGFDTAALHTVAASPDGTALDSCTQPDSDCYIDLFDCASGIGRSSGLPAQNYLTWIEITDSVGANVWATSDEKFVDISAADMGFDTTILNNGGYFRLSWSLFGERTGSALTCADTAAASPSGGYVQTTAMISTGGSALADRFNCEDHFGYSDPLPTGRYTVLVDARDRTNTPISSQPVAMDNALIGTGPNDVVDLGHVLIPVAGL